MRDELFDRDYEQARAAINTGIDEVLAALVSTLRVLGETLHREHWSAPWCRPAKRRNRAEIV